MPKLEKDEQNIHKGHRQRMRERFIKTGLNGFSSHEILEFLLYPCLAQKDTNRIAHRLISEFGNINGVFTAPVKEIAAVEGVGETTATFISFVGSLIESKAEQYDDRVPLDTNKKIAEFFRPLFDNCNVENIFVLALDREKKPIRNMRITDGTFDTATVSIPKITRLLVSNGAHYAAIAHNHTSGIMYPSIQDIRTTQKLMAALDSVGVSLEDHFIFAGEGYVSLKDSGSKLYSYK